MSAEKEQRDKALDDAIRLLGDHFDAVQIVGTAQKEDGSGASLFSGRGYGNIYCRIQLCREFILRGEEQTRLEVQKEDESG